MSVGLVVEILGDASKLGDSIKGAKGEAGGLGGLLGGTGVKVAAFAGVASIAAVAITEMTMAAAADRDEQAKLEQAISAAGAATAESTAQVEAAIVAGQARAFTDSQTRDALQSLVTATGDVTTATTLLATAQDVARFANVDLAVAADAVAKAQAGQAGPLAKLIPGLEKGTSATETLANATAAAAGQADLYAKSSEGMQARAGDSLGELAETIGEVFLPVLDAIIPALLPILDAFGQLVKALLPLLVPLIQALGKYLAFVAGNLVTVVGWLVKLVNWVTEAIGAVGDFISTLNPLRNIQLPSLPFLSSAPASSGPAAAGRAGVGATSSSSSGQGPTINVYTTGDSIEAEQAVVRALRRVTRLNGGVIPARGWAT